jgi:pimeloyl-ACP methyl ester carboxylesterase
MIAYRGEMLMERFTVRNGATTISVLADGPPDSADPPVLCVHGWPELAWSWRHQIAHFAGKGRRIAAMDVRGYGESSKPAEIAAYAMAELCSDVAAVIDSLGGRAILFGHDWGAPIVWQTSLRYPDKVLAVAGLSVPYVPMSDTSFLDAVRKLYAGRFFYQLYFQEPGVAEAEFDADPDALAKIYYGISGEGIAEYARHIKAPGEGFLLGMPMPDALPGWLPAEDLAVYKSAFAAGGWTGPLNRYRAQDIDFAERATVVGRRIAQPATFIAGTLDPVRRFVPGVDGYADAGAACDDFRGATLIEGAGHWVQQEAADETNRALERFLGGL